MTSVSGIVFAHLSAVRNRRTAVHTGRDFINLSFLHCCPALPCCV